MSEIAISPDEFARFLRQLHQRPDVSGNRKPAVGRTLPPFYQPACGRPSISMPNGEGEGDDLLQRLGTLLWQTLGYTQVRLYPPLRPGTGTEAAARRPLASGGARYPVDLHVLVPADIAGALAPCAGKVLAYAPQYHRLFLTGTLEAGTVPGPSELAIVVSLDFARTWEKYGDFGYRLSAVDAGLVVGRLQTLASRWSEASVDVDVDAAALDAALGLDPTCQATYCVVRIRPHGGRANGPAVRLEELSVPPRTPSSGRLPRRFQAVHRAAHAAALTPHSWAQPLLRFLQPQLQSAEVIALPGGAQASLPDAIAARRSRAHAFTGAAVRMEVMRACLDGMQRCLRDVLTAADAALETPRLLVCSLQVAGLAPGLYSVDEGVPVLRALVAGEHGATLARAQLLSSFDLQKAAFIVYVCTRRWQAGDPRGPRAYRVDQMLAGAALDAGTLAVSSERISAHAYLGFDADAIARLYGLHHDVNVAAQLCVGATAAGCELARPVVIHTA